MNLFNYYWYFKSALTPKFCDDVIQYALQKKEVMARTGGYGDKKLNKQEVLDLKRKRNSDLVWLDDTWIYKEFTKYKLNQYYDWHCDSWDKPYDRPGKIDHGMIRKLSMTCQLTDGSEYRGGELEFDFRNYDPHMRDESKHRIQCKEILSKGSIIIFPSFVWHRVKPVTSGTRYSLVVWNIGRPFR
jgi:PKHD-type hydroxylase